MTLLELAERCEKATGPDRELDAEIAVAALGFFVAEPRYEGAPVAYGYVDKGGCRVEPGHGGKQLIRDFTASLDAAMTLVPDGYEWGAGSWGNPDTDGPWAWCATRQQSADNDLDYGKAATPALALCAAALKARTIECVPNTPEGDG